MNQTGDPVPDGAGNQQREKRLFGSIPAYGPARLRTLMINLSRSVADLLARFDRSVLDLVARLEGRRFRLSGQIADRPSRRRYASRQGVDNIVALFRSPRFIHSACSHFRAVWRSLSLTPVSPDRPTGEAIHTGEFPPIREEGMSDTKPEGPGRNGPTYLFLRPGFVAFAVGLGRMTVALGSNAHRR